jgi:DNA polymerase elongation subunit (family B)
MFLLDVFEVIVDRRLEAKHSGDKKTADSLKITINGTFGKLGSKYSTMYAPNLLIQVTVGGQLNLLMLIEMLELHGITVVSANTDGIVSLVEKHQEETFLNIITGWEHLTKLKTEETEYKALFSRDVNNYIAVKHDNSCKLKGTYSNPWAGNAGRHVRLQSQRYAG